MTVRVLTNFTPVSPEDYLVWFDLSSRPLLELSRRDAQRARGVKIEWLVDRPIGDGSVWERRALTNYTQILRQPIRIDHEKRETFTEAAKRVGEKILDDAERVLWHGRPGYDFTRPQPISMCGGVLHYLRRRLYENDTVGLRELTPLTLRRFGDERYDGDWVWEFSLQVTAGYYERGMTPLALPPEPRPVKPWAQGASLLEA